MSATRLVDSNIYFIIFLISELREVIFEFARYLPCLFIFFIKFRSSSQYLRIFHFIQYTCIYNTSSDNNTFYILQRQNSYIFYIFTKFLAPIFFFRRYVKQRRTNKTYVHRIYIVYIYFFADLFYKIYIKLN